YYRWLNSDGDPYMHSRIDVWNGNQWINIWASAAFFFDTDWTYFQHDITNYKNAQMKIRFGMDVKQMEFSSFSGWNLDDVLVASRACPYPLILRLPLRIRLAAAPLLGALLLAIGNAADVAATLRMPPGGVAARAAHHAFDALDTLALGLV